MENIIQIVLITWGIFIFGLKIKKDYPITAIASFMLMAIGLEIYIYGLKNISILISQSFGLIHLAIGAYTIIRGSYETYKDFELKTDSIISIGIKKLIDWFRR